MVNVSNFQINKNRWPNFKLIFIRKSLFVVILSAIPGIIFSSIALFLFVMIVNIISIDIIRGNVFGKNVIYSVDIRYDEQEIQALFYNKWGIKYNKIITFEKFNYRLIYDQYKQKSRIEFIEKDNHHFALIEILGKNKWEDETIDKLLSELMNVKKIEEHPTIYL